MIRREVVDTGIPETFDFFNDYHDTFQWLAMMRQYKLAVELYQLREKYASSNKKGHYG